MRTNLLLLFATMLVPQTTSPALDADVRALTRLETQWNDGHLFGDASALDRLWADEFVATVPKMTTLAKQDALAFLRSGRMKFVRYESSDLVVRVYGDAAVVTGRVLRTRELAGKPTLDDWRFTKVYVRRAGHWRVVAFHASDAGG